MELKVGHPDKYLQGRALMTSQLVHYMVASLEFGGIFIFS